ncbi:MAG: hypothetical protein KatS3mg076_0336 [Candidatus Binatia bacterium]|nr:MAG: hypothetical protein KatS3mg076_0336 [Candidatus Binatia bacterium]
MRAAQNIRPAEEARPEALRFGGGSSRGPAEPPFANVQLAAFLLVAASAMLFASLLSALVILRGASLAWPPPDQPFLPLGITMLNTAVLLSSGLSVYRATRKPENPEVPRLLLRACLLGGVFLAIQGVEWARLVSRGLTLASSLYGTMFYSLIGLHALHVGGALGWLAHTALRSRSGIYSRHPAGLRACATYWYFVCGLWLVLFFVVYLP